MLSIWTDALVIIEQPPITRIHLNAIREASINDGKATINIEKNPPIEGFLDVLNQFIVSYSRHAGVPWGGVALRMLGLQEFLMTQPVRYAVLIPGGDRLTDEEAETLFRPHGTFLSEDQISHLVGHLDDLDPPNLRGIETGIALQERFIHYEYMFRSISSKLAGDLENGLLAAVIALEGAFSGFVRLVLQERLLASGVTSKDAKQTLDDFLRVPGISALLPVVSLLMLEEGERPTAEEIKACKKGITMRNQIMHTLIDTSSGLPTVRKHDIPKLESARSAVSVVYQMYADAIERRLGSTASLLT